MRPRRLVATLGIAGLMSGLAVTVAQAVPGPNPVGQVDVGRWDVSRVKMSGWAFDRDALARPERVSIYQTYPSYRLVAVTSTTISRADVNRAHGISGNHGWAASFASAPGRHTFCAWAMNLGAGTNTRMGCRAVTVPVPSVPAGHLDSTTVGQGTATMSGWALDRDDLRHPEAVQVWESTPGRPFTRLWARTTTTGHRADVNRVQQVSGDHGWQATFTITPGPHTLCAWAVNVGAPAAHRNTGCRTVTVPAPSVPSGSVDQAIVSHSTITMSGWALDRDDVVNAEPIDIWESTPGQPFTRLWARTTTTGYREDVNTVSQVSGNHGWQATFTVTPGPHTLCAWAVNVGAPAANRNIGCRTIETQRELLAWGANSDGQLGDGTLVSTSSPTWAYGVPGVTAISGGAGRTFMLTSAGTVWAVGRPTAQLTTTPQQVPGLSNVTQIASSVSSSYALRDDGTVWAWGHNETGQLGDGTTTYTDIPVKVLNVSHAVRLAASNTVTQTRAITSDGLIWHWGCCAGAYPPTSSPAGTTTDIAYSGDYSYTNQVTLRGDATADGLFAGPLPGGPQITWGVALSNVTAIAIWGETGYAVKGDGTVWAWGANDAGQLGDGTTVSATTDQTAAVQVPGLSGITAIAVGNGSAYALKSDGTVWAWGRNDLGQLGINSTDTAGCKCVSTPQRVAIDVPIKAIGATDGSAFAIPR